MSFIVRVVIGHYDAADAMARHRPPRPVRHLAEEEVARLQAVCEQVLPLERPLAARRSGGLLWFEGRRVSAEMYLAACAAHTLYGAIAVDVLHGEMVYPADEPLPARDELLEQWRQLTSLGTDEVERQVDAFLADQEEAAADRREIRERVWEILRPAAAPA
jgi:hypothetical protein